MNCINCSFELTSTSLFCQNCGQKVQKREDPNPTASPFASPNRIWGVWGVVALIVLMTFFFSQLSGSLSGSLFSSSESSNSSDASQASPTQDEQSSAEPWFPYGFSELTDGIAYKSLGKGNMDCGYSSPHSCYQIYVVTKYSCELFVRVNFLADGIVVDDALDSASVSAGEQAVLTFASLKAANYEGSKKIKFTEATCY